VAELGLVDESQLVELFEDERQLRVYLTALSLDLLVCFLYYFLELFALVSLSQLTLVVIVFVGDFLAKLLDVLQEVVKVLFDIFHLR
jgi:hypothetical protein